MPGGLNPHSEVGSGGLGCHNDHTRLLGQPHSRVEQAHHPVLHHPRIIEPSRVRRACDDAPPLSRRQRTVSAVLAIATRRPRESVRRRRLDAPILPFGFPMGYPSCHAELSRIPRAGRYRVLHGHNLQSPRRSFLVDELARRCLREAFHTVRIRHPFNLPQGRGPRTYRRLCCGVASLPPQTPRLQLRQTEVGQQDHGRSGTLALFPRTSRRP